MKKSKKKFSIMLLVAMALKMLMAPAIFLDYQIRKDFIIKNYCVNKNRPEMHCDGKCYLAKKIKEAQEKDERQATENFISKLFLIESEVKNNNFSDFFPSKYRQIKQNPLFRYIESISSKFVMQFFKPPMA